MNITFRSDREPDFACLEQYLIGGAFGSLPDTWRHQAEQDIDVLRNGLNEISKQTTWITNEMRERSGRFTDIELPTRYDSPTQYRILDGLVRRIRRAAKRLELEAHDFPHHACIPSGLVNASAVVLPGASRAFVLFDSELFLYCHLFAKVFARCLPIIERGQNLLISVDPALVRERIESTPEVLERFIDLLAVYARTGSPSRSKQYPLEADYVHLVTILRNGMELFVVGHEFGHVYSGHLSHLLDRLHIKSDDLFGESDAHRQEHEADMVGLLLTLQAMADSGYDAALSYAGIELFFVSLDLAARASHVIANGNDDFYTDEASISHPSHTQRRVVMHSGLEAFIGSKEQVRGAKAMAAKYTEISGLLWQYARVAQPLNQRTVESMR